MEEKVVKKYLTKKRLIFIIVFFVVAIGLFAANILFVLNVDWKELFSYLAKCFAHSTAWLWLILLFAYCIVRFFTNYLPMKMLLNRYKIKLTFWEEVNFTMTMFFLLMISPSVFLTDPYIAYFLHKKGLDFKKVSSCVIVNEIASQVAVLLLSIPSLIYITINYSNIHASGKDFFFWLCIIGTAIDIIVFSFTVLIGFSTTLQYYIARFINFIKRIFKMKCQTKEEIRHHIYEEKAIRLEVIKLLKCYWLSFGITGLLFITFFTNYLVIYFAFRLLNLGENNLNGVEFWSTFNIVNSSSTASRFIPIPGQSFTTEGIIVNFLQVEKLNIFDWKVQPSSNDLSKFVSDGVLIWRMWVLYIPALVGVPFFIYSMVSPNAIKR